MSRWLAFVSLGVLALVFFEVIRMGPDTSDKILGGALILYAAYRVAGNLRGSRQPFDEVTEMFRQADAIRKDDPAAAQRFVDNYFQEKDRRRDQERATLRAQAATDLGAARRLEAMLREDLRFVRDLRVRFLSRLDATKRVAAETSNKQREREIEAELRQLQDSMRLART